MKAVHAADPWIDNPLLCDGIAKAETGVCSGGLLSVHTHCANGCYYAPPGRNDDGQ